VDISNPTNDIPCECWDVSLSAVNSEPRLRKQQYERFNVSRQEMCICPCFARRMATWTDTTPRSASLRSWYLRASLRGHVELTVNCEGRVASNCLLLSCHPTRSSMQPKLFISNFRSDSRRGWLVGTVQVEKVVRRRIIQSHEPRR
jgi:hypothetical protein